jgi:hypothetical protein
VTRAKIAAGAFAVVLLVLLSAGALWWVAGRNGEPAASTSPTARAADGATQLAPETQQGFLYGRVTAADGTVYEGRLRFGGTEEAFWDDHFNGYKAENPWAAHVPPDRLTERRPVEVFGVKLGSREVEIELRRPFMARFGDVVRIDGRNDGLRVTLKSGTVFDLDRFNADDLADGLRVWDGTGGVVDLTERQIRVIELLPTAVLSGAPARLHGTVLTRQGAFTGFVQWDMEECVGSDELIAPSDGGTFRLRFDSIRSIARRSGDGALVTLRDGREIELSGTRKVGSANRGIAVENPRYGRVLVSWQAFERVDFTTGGGSGPGYEDFPPGNSLSGTVTTRAGRTLAGRLVYDLDESETTETLDAPSGGVSYTIPFGLIASITPDGGVTLHDGGTLELERAGDLSEDNGGLLVFDDGSEQPEYVPWAEVERIDLDLPHSPPTMFPPVDGRDDA